MIIAYRLARFAVKLAVSGAFFGLIVLALVAYTPR